MGARLQVTGTVQEFVPGADPVQPPLTELAGALTIVPLATGEPLPVPIAITASDINPTSGLDALEKVEGMRVSFASLTVTAPTQGFLSEASATSTSSGIFYAVVTGVARPFREPGIQVPDPLPPARRRPSRASTPTPSACASTATRSPAPPPSTCRPGR